MSRVSTRDGVDPRPSVSSLQRVLRERARRQAKPFRCQECGARYTLKGAERAQRNGCKAGCSGIDIDIEAER